MTFGMIVATATRRRILMDCLNVNESDLSSVSKSLLDKMKSNELIDDYSYDVQTIRWKELVFYNKKVIIEVDGTTYAINLI